MRLLSSEIKLEHAKTLSSILDYDLQNNLLVPREAEFFLALRESVLRGMEKVLGKAGVESTFYHLELSTCVETPVKFHSMLYSMFGSGTVLLEKAILAELFQRFDLSFGERKACSYSDCVYEVGKIFLLRKKDNR